MANGRELPELVPLFALPLFALLPAPLPLSPLLDAVAPGVALAASEGLATALPGVALAVPEGVAAAVLGLVAAVLGEAVTQLRGVGVLASSSKSSESSPSIEL